jgi:hypothetical protein
MVNKKTTDTCSQCNSPLILISKETVQPEGSRFLQTNTIYRCSNEECQAEKDNQKAKRMHQVNEKIKSDQKRLEKNQERKRLELTFKI